MSFPFLPRHQVASSACAAVPGPMTAKRSRDTSRLAAVAPPNAMNFYLSYWQSLRQDLPMQELREQATATIRAISNALFKVGFGAWSIWRRRKISHVTQRQRALRRAAKAAAAVAEEQRWNTELSHFRNRTAMLLRISRCKRLKQMRRASRTPRF
jgi:hypothetical protein